MKFMFSQLSYFFRHKYVRRNIRSLLTFLAFIALAIIIYSTIFHFIMEHEGRHYSMITGLYWTLTVMSTLGFGDITFHGDLGRIFSIVVLLSGIVFFLIMLPFTFIKFFYAPWLESQAESRAPRKVPTGIKNHVIITNLDPVARSLIRKLKQYDYKYFIAVNDIQDATELHDKGYNVVVGCLDKSETYSNMRVESAALALVNNNDIINTNIVATIREASESIPIVTNVDLHDSIDILELAGATYVFQFERMLGVTIAQHVLGASTQANVLGGFGELLIAEAHAFRTPFEDKKLIESNLRELTGINVIGIWKRGRFEIPHPQSHIDSSTILLLAGSEEHFKRYDEFIGIHRTFAAPVVIVGGGRVGQAAADVLSEKGIDFKIVEKDKNLIKNDECYIHGSAADLHTLERAGISQEAPSVLITTHDDDINVYLTIYCRKLRSNIQIISRATLDRNIGKLYNAGADIVLSFASMGSNRIINILKPDEILMLAEGLNVFKAAMPSVLQGKPLSENNIRKNTGCSVVAIRSGKKMNINPTPDVILNKGDELILIGTAFAEKVFLESYY